MVASEQLFTEHFKSPDIFIDYGTFEEEVF